MRKKLICGILAVSMMGIFVGCDEIKSSNDKQSEAQETLMQEAERTVGQPNIVNYTERKLAKKIFELRDRSDLVTYAYTQNMDGQYVYLGTCIGYGLPYSVQYTNPEKKVSAYDVTLPQSDPNALFMPEGLSATWLILVDEETGEQSIIYAEPEIIVSQTKLPKRLVVEWSLPSNY